MFMLMAAYKVMAKCWISAGRLTLHFWYSKLWQIRIAGKPSHQLRKAKRKDD